MIPEGNSDIRNERRATEIVHICVNIRLMDSLKFDSLKIVTLSDVVFSGYGI